MPETFDPSARTKRWKAIEALNETGGFWFQEIFAGGLSPAQEAK